MTLTQLEYLIAVDDHRHFGKAARACHVTQPTLSMQLQKLEEELGVILFDGSKSPVPPTTEGEPTIEQARVNLIIQEARPHCERVCTPRAQRHGSSAACLDPTHG